MRFHRAPHSKSSGRRLLVNGSETHPGGTAYNFKNARHRIDTPYSVDVGGEIVHQQLLTQIPFAE
jgi:hypothetical protein